MMYRIFYLFSVVFVYLLSLIALAPLAWIVEQAPLPPRLKLEQVQGRIWDGKIGQLSYQQYQLNNIQWEIDLLPLLMAQVQGSISAGDSPELSLAGQFNYGFNGLRLNDVSADASAQFVSKQLKLPVPANLAGEFQLRVAEYQQGQPWCEQLQGRLSWFSPSIENPFIQLQLDDATSQWQCQSGELVGKIDHKDAQLELQAEVKVGAKQAQVSGGIKAGSELDPQIARGLSFIGAADSQGFYRFKQSQRLY